MRSGILLFFEKKKDKGKCISQGIIDMCAMVFKLHR